MNNICEVLRANLIKTIYFNFRVLPFHQAIRFPFLIYRHVYLKSLSGKIVFTVPVHSGMAKVGG